MGAVLKLREVWYGIFRSFSGRSLVFACLGLDHTGFFVRELLILPPPNYLLSAVSLGTCKSYRRVSTVFPTRGEKVDITPGLDALSIRFPRQCRDY